MKGWLIDGGDEWLRDGERSIISGPTSRELPTARASRRDFAREVTSANSSSGPSHPPHPPRRLAHTSTLSSWFFTHFSPPFSPPLCFPSNWPESHASFKFLENPTRSRSILFLSIPPRKLKNSNDENFVENFFSFQTEGDACTQGYDDGK